MAVQCEGEMPGLPHPSFELMRGYPQGYPQAGAYRVAQSLVFSTKGILDEKEIVMLKTHSSIDKLLRFLFQLSS